MSTAVWPLQSALYTRYTGDGTLAARLAGGKVYDEGAVPEGALLSYLVFGTTNEGAWDSFNRDGNDSAPMLHIWAATKSAVAAIYADIERLTNNQSLTVTGHSIALLTTRLLTVMRDPSGPMHGVVALRVLSQAGA